MNSLELGGSLNNLAQAIENKMDPNLADLQAIIEFGSKIPLAGNVVSKHSKKTGSSTAITGHTKEAGDLQINLDNSEETFKTSGLPTERVGYYVLHRRVSKKTSGVISGFIFFQHWKEVFCNKAGYLDDGETALREQNVYVIQYNETSLVPIGIGKEKLESFKYLPLSLSSWLKCGLQKAFFALLDILINREIESKMKYTNIEAIMRLNYTWQAK